MKKFFVYSCAVAVAAVMMSSCKSKESAYKAVYDQAMAERETTTTTNVAANQQTSPVEVTPVTPVTKVNTTPVSNDSNVRVESVQLVSGTGLKAYSVVVGSYGVKANAERQQADLKRTGYDAQIVFNPTANTYRVVATTFDDKAAATQSRDALRTSVNAGAWLLYAK